MSDGIYSYSQRILDNIGLFVRIEFDANYVQMRDRLYLMSPLRRWLSWRLRRRYARLLARQQERLLSQVIEQGIRTWGNHDD